MTRAALALLAAVALTACSSGPADGDSDAFPDHPSDWVEVPGPVEGVTVWCHYETWYGPKTLVCVAR